LRREANYKNLSSRWSLRAEDLTEEASQSPPPYLIGATPGRDYERVRRCAGYAEDRQSASEASARRYPCGAKTRQIRHGMYIRMYNTDDREERRTAAHRREGAAPANQQGGRVNQESAPDEYAKRVRQESTPGEYARRVRQASTPGEYARRVRQASTPGEYARRKTNQAEGLLTKRTRDKSKSSHSRKRSTNF